MAVAERSPRSPRRRDLCSRSIWLARKIRSDLTALTESYVKHQGLSDGVGLDSADGVPVASTARWGELTEAERLLENVRAYRAFRVLLAGLLEDREVPLAPAGTDLQRALHALGLQVSALACQLEELMALLEHAVPPPEPGEVPVASTARWGELTEAERLLENVHAYRAFRVLLARLLEDREVPLAPAGTDLQRALHALGLQVSALACQLEELMALLEHAVPPPEPGEVPAAAGGLFEKKLWGLQVLRELSQWAVRSTRDLRVVSSRRPGAAAPDSRSLTEDATV